MTRIQRVGERLQYIGSGVRAVAPKSAAAAFSPADIAGLQLWLDFSDTTNLYTDAAKTTPVSSDGDVIGAAADKSGQGNDVLQTITASKPLYKTGIQNSLSIGRFDGINDVLGSAAYAAALSQPNTISLVALANAAGSVNFVDGAGATRHVIRPSTETSILIYAGTSLTLSPTISAFSFVVYTAIFNGASSELFMNTASEGTGNVGSQSMGEVNIGASGSDTEFVNGDIAEVLIYDTALSAGDRGSVETYLNNKWAVY